MATLVADSSSESAGGSRELLRVALPLVISSGSTSLMYVVDRVFLTWYSTDALAAALPATMLYWSFVSMIYGTVNYVNTFVAQYEGARRKHRVAAVIWQGVYFSIFAGLQLLWLVPLAPAMFKYFAPDSDVLKLEVQYFNVFCYGTVPLLVSTALSCFFSGRGQTRVIMFVNVTSLIINAVLDYLLIFGAAGFPRCGIAGAAIATTTAYVAAAIMYVAVILLSGQARAYEFRSARTLDSSLMRRLLKFGFPSGVQQLGESVCFLIFLLLIANFGKESLQATNLAFNLNSLAFVPLLGLGTAVMTLTGRRVVEGRPDLAVRTTWRAFGLASMYLAVFCGIYLFGPDLILWPYAANTEPAEFDALRAEVIPLLRFVAVYCFFDAMTVIFSSATRGAGDTRFALLLNLFGGVFILVLPTYVVARYTSLGLTGAWTCVTAFVMLLGLGFFARFQQGRWKTMRVIEQTVADV